MLNFFSYLGSPFCRVWVLFQEYSLVPCRVYGGFLSFPELSHSQTQHSTDKLIPNFNFLARTSTFLGMFHFLFASMAAFFSGWPFRKKQIQSVYKNYSPCSSIESNKPGETRMLTAISIARELQVTPSYQVQSIGFHTVSEWIYQHTSWMFDLARVLSVNIKDLAVITQ